MAQIAPVWAPAIIRIVLLAGLLLECVIGTGVIADGLEIEQGGVVGQAFIQKEVVLADPL